VGIDSIRLVNQGVDMVRAQNGHWYLQPTGGRQFDPTQAAGIIHRLLDSPTQEIKVRYKGQDNFVDAVYTALVEQRGDIKGLGNYFHSNPAFSSTNPTYRTRDILYGDNTGTLRTFKPDVVAWPQGDNWQGSALFLPAKMQLQETIVNAAGTPAVTSPLGANPLVGQGGAAEALQEVRNNNLVMRTEQALEKIEAAQNRPTSPTSPTGGDGPDVPTAGEAARQMKGLSLQRPFDQLTETQRQMAEQAYLLKQDVILRAMRTRTDEGGLVELRRLDLAGGETWTIWHRPAGADAFEVVDIGVNYHNNEVALAKLQELVPGTRNWALVYFDRWTMYNDAIGDNAFFYTRTMGLEGVDDSVAGIGDADGVMSVAEKQYQANAWWGYTNMMKGRWGYSVSSLANFGSEEFTGWNQIDTKFEGLTD
jgi:hypothetical protein